MKTNPLQEIRDMNTFNTTTVIKTLMISLMTVGFFGGAAAMADQVGNSVASKKVSLSDLDLATAEGRQVAQDRLHQLARALCAQVADPTDMSHHDNYLACMDATLAKAGASLQALVKKQSSEQFARAGWK
jgi:UrcA family protein